MFYRFSAIALFGLFCAAASVAKADDFSQQFIPAKPPHAVPNLNFEDAKGRAFSLADFRGRYILLNLWASWCAPCVHEMPALDALRNKFNYRQFEVMALSEDHEGSAAVQAFTQRYSLQHMPIFIDKSGQGASLVGAKKGLPTTLFIDPNGVEIGRIEGEAAWNSPEAVAFINKWIQHTKW